MRRWLLALAALCFAVGLGFTAFAGWLLNTTSGAVWLLEKGASATGVQMTAGRIEGSLTDELLVADLVIAWAEGQMLIRNIKLDGEPLSALQGNLTIKLLEIDQCVIETFSFDKEARTHEQSGTVASGPDFSVGDLRFLPDWLTVEIEALLFKGLLFQDAEGSVTVFDSLSGAFLASQQQLRSSAFRYLSSSVALSGHFDWDLSAPHLEMIADVHLPEELIDSQLFENIALPVDFPGRVSIAGDWNNFSGPVSFGVETEDLSKVWLAADAQGSWQGIHFRDLKGHYLGGRLNGALELWWHEFFRVRGQVLGSGLNPGIFLNDLEGLATLDLAGELLISYDDNPLNAQITGKILAGQLRGANVSGDLALAWENNTLHAVDIDLSSKETRLTLQGKPAERLDMDVSIGDLGALYAGLSGQLHSSGWLRWADGYLTGELSGSGSEVVWQEASLQSLHFQANHVGKQAPLNIVMDGRLLRYDNMQSDALHVEVSGSLGKHTLLATMSDSTGQLSARFSGGYRDAVWLGDLTALDGETAALGSWSLEKPAALEWTNGSFSLTGLTLNGRGGGNVSIGIKDLGDARNSSLTLHWREIQHDWLTYLQPDLRASGQSSGDLLLEVANYQPVTIQANLAGNFSVKNDYSPLDIPSIDLEMVWIDSGLNLAVKAETASGEHFKATVVSTQPPAWQWPSEQLLFTTKWKDVDLGRLSALREGLEVQGRSDGHGQFEIKYGALQQAKAEITAAARMLEGGEEVGFRALRANVLWDEKLFRSEARIEGAHDGLLSLNLTSTADPDLSWLGSGSVDLVVNDFDLRSLVPLLPREVDLVGAIRGEANGFWRESGEVSLQGRLGVTDEGLAWHLPGGSSGDVFQSADLDWQWQGSQLAGQLEALLASGGQLQGYWQLPLSAHWPLNFDTEGPITANLKGESQLSDMITFIVPDVFQDVRGKLIGDLSVSGTLKSPHFSGSLKLPDAGAYLPATGATISDLLMHVSLRDDEIHLDKLSLKSGEGTLLATGMMEFDRWQLEGYRFALQGERLHLYDFPELQVFVSPDLTLEGDSSRSKLSGNLLIPKMSLIDKSTGTQALPSDDVVISGEDDVERDKFTLHADIRVVVELGNEVKVKTEGVEARLEGGVTIATDEKQHLAGWGEIRLVDGVYKAYGTNLAIKQGVMLYNNDPLINPKLRVFAAKDVGRVQAGVHITGTAENPVVTLTSTPAMPERDILGYLFMGRPISTDGEGGDALAIGAGALLPNYGDSLADYGVVELDLEGLLKDEGGVRLRKRLSESWEISSTLGTESGIDLFYLLDFD